jgi:hypothetical protein
MHLNLKNIIKYDGVMGVGGGGGVRPKGVSKGVSNSKPYSDSWQNESMVPDMWGGGRNTYLLGGSRGDGGILAPVGIQT